MPIGSFFFAGFLDMKRAKDPRERMRKIKYESELDLSFGERVAAKAYEQKLLSCIQCGTCGSTCPLSPYMDYTPRKIIAMTREGFKDEVLHSFTIWLCSSCYACTVQCPRQIHITDIMYTLKREAMAANAFPKKYPIPIFSKTFFNLVHRYGRNSEGLLLLFYYLKSQPLKLLQNAYLGLRLIIRGRMSVGREKVRDIIPLQKLLKEAGREEKTV